MGVESGEGHLKTDAYLLSLPPTSLAALSLLRGRERRSWDRGKQPPVRRAVSRSHSRSRNYSVHEFFTPVLRIADHSAPACRLPIRLRRGRTVVPR